MQKQACQCAPLSPMPRSRCSIGPSRWALLLLLGSAVAKPLTREERLPTVEQRVKLYMSNWYEASCRPLSYTYQNSDDGWSTLMLQDLENMTLAVESIIEPDKMFFVDERTLNNCVNGPSDDKLFTGRVQFRENMLMYCSDAADSMVTAVDHTEVRAPILMQFGDLKHSHVYRDVNVPHFKKFRSAAVSPEALEQASCANPLATVHSTTKLQPIVWKLATSRHFRLANQVYRDDVPWENKVDMAVFRGQLTGSPEGYDKSKSDRENCWNMRRCRLVVSHANSTLVHAKLTSTRGRIADTLDGVELVGPKVTMRKLLQFKGIIMLEGNDVASGLKWALLSQSVVLMPPPRHTSWLMEELLVPWVHYIPLKEDLTDVEEKMQWVVDHDEEARKIADQGSLWMDDLCFHPDAKEDDRLIQEEMVRRYQAHFVDAPTMLAA